MTDSLSNCANAGGIFYVGLFCGLIVAGLLYVAYRIWGDK